MIVSISRWGVQESYKWNAPRAHYINSHGRRVNSIVSTEMATQADQLEKLIRQTKIDDEWFPINAERPSERGQRPSHGKVLEIIK